MTLRIPARPAWHARAACRTEDPATFFPERGQSSTRAKRICASCEVLSECDAAALAEGEFLHGIWAGQSKPVRVRRLRGEAAA